MILKNYHQLISKDGKIKNFIKEFNSYRKCPISNCGAPSIKSHSISEKYIKMLAVNGNVLHVPLILGDKNTIDCMELQSPSNVSIFYGFCNEHDNNLFKSLENFSGLPYEKDIKLEEVILMSLRAIARRDYMNDLQVEAKKQHDKYAYERYEKYIKETKYYLNRYMQALSNPILIDYLTFDMPSELSGHFFVPTMIVE